MTLNQKLGTIFANLLNIILNYNNEYRNSKILQ